MTRLVSKGKNIKQYFEPIDPNFEAEKMGFGVFEPFLQNLDVFTREYLRYNEEILRGKFESRSFSYGYLRLEELQPMIRDSEVFKNKFNYMLKLKAATGYNHERFFEINFDEF